MWNSVFHKPLSQWRREYGQRRLAKKLAVQVLPELKADILRKSAKCSSSELLDYARTRAAQLIHPRVDELLKSDATLEAASGNELIVLASEQAVKLATAVCVARKPRAA